MSAVNWVEIAEQVATTVCSPLLERVAPEDRIWLAVDREPIWWRLSYGEQCVLRVAHALFEIGHELAYVDADLRAEIENLIFTALRDTPETV